MPGFWSGATARLVVFAALLPAVVPAQEIARDVSNITLTEAQRQSLRAMQAASTLKAASGLAALVETSRKFKANLLSETPDPQLDQELSRQMADAFAEIIRHHLDRIRSAAGILTREQKAALAEELKKPGAPFLFDDLVRKALGEPKK